VLCAGVVFDGCLGASSAVNMGLGVYHGLRRTLWCCSLDLLLLMLSHHGWVLTLCCLPLWQDCVKD
jgi:hypothetical protein